MTLRMAQAFLETGKKIAPYIFDGKQMESHQGDLEILAKAASEVVNAPKEARMGKSSFEIWQRNNVYHLLAHLVKLILFYRVGVH